MAITCVFAAFVAAACAGSLLMIALQPGDFLLTSLWRKASLGQTKEKTVTDQMTIRHHLASRTFPQLHAKLNFWLAKPENASIKTERTGPLFGDVEQAVGFSIPPGSLTGDQRLWLGEFTRAWRRLADN